MKKVIIFGASYPIILQTIDDINASGDDKFEVIGFSVDNEDDWGKEYFGYPILGRLEDLKIHSDIYIINNVGGSTISRYIVDQRILKIRKTIPSIIHPTVEKRYCDVNANGVILSKDVFLGAGTKIGDSVCIRNTTFIGNEVNIGNYVFISDQTVILGYVNIDDFVYIGAHVTVLPRLSLEKNCLLGAGSVVTKNIPTNKMYVGNPARFLKDNFDIPIID